MAAHLAPDDIPRSLFAALLDAHGPAERLRVNDPLNALHRFSLITSDGDSVSVHRLLQQSVRDHLPAEDRARAWSSASSAVATAWNTVGDTALPQCWPRCEQLLEHVLAITRTAVAGDAQSVALLIGAGLYLLHAAPERAITVNQAAVDQAELVLGPQHPDTLTTRGNLAAARDATTDGEAGEQPPSP